MKMNFKKTLSLILAVLMVMTAVPLSGMATEEVCTHANTTVFSIGLDANTGEYRHYVNNCTDCGVNGVQVCEGADATSCGEAKKCTICNQVIGAALDHTFVPGVEDETTLKEAGANCQVANTYYETCTECGEKSETRFFPSETNVGPHDWDEGTKTYDDCEEAGTCTYKCQNDNCEAERTETIDAIGHDFDKVEDDEFLVADSVATCKKGAEYYYSCVNCGEKGTETFFSETTGEHNFVEIANPEENALLKSAATCSNPAEYYKGCSECHISAKHVEDVENPTFTYGEPHAKPTSKDDVRRPLKEDERVTIINADCYTDAKYAMHCKECGEPMITEKEDFAKEGLHFYEAEGTALNPGHRDLTKLELVTDRVEPSCTKAGQEAIYKCKEGINCPDANWDKIGGELIPEKGHSFDPDKTTAYEMSDSCTGGGRYGRKYCTACKTSFFYDDKGVEVDKMSGLQEKTIEGKRHVNNNSDDLCDVCGYVVTPEETCTCICHKTGFMYIVALFLKLFWKFTGTKPYCYCGKAHY